MRGKRHEYKKDAVRKLAIQHDPPRKQDLYITRSTKETAVLRRARSLLREGIQTLHLYGTGKVVPKCISIANQVRAGLLQQCNVQCDIGTVNAHDELWPDMKIAEQHRYGHTGRYKNVHIITRKLSSIHITITAHELTIPTGPGDASPQGMSAEDQTDTGADSGKRKSSVDHELDIIAARSSELMDPRKLHQKRKAKRAKTHK